MQSATLSGTTAHFSGNGRQLGYPTANLAAKTDLPDGVYFGYADLAEYKHHPALVFIGTPTTVGDTDRRVEAFLLDVEDRDYYDQQLTVELVEYHRPNQTFGSIDELMTVMKADEAAGRKWFAKPAVR